MKYVIIIFFLTYGLLAFDISQNYSETITCEKSDIYFLENDEQEEIKSFEPLFESINEVCSWGEMINFTKKDKCEEFKNRKESLKELTFVLNEKFNKLNKMHTQWNKYLLCSNYLRFDAKNFKNNLEIPLTSIKKNINSLKTCKNDINYNVSYNCNKTKRTMVTESNVNFLKKTKKNPFKKYVPKNPFQKKGGSGFTIKKL